MAARLEATAGVRGLPPKDDFTGETTAAEGRDRPLSHAGRLREFHHLARLRELHDEAAETALLANLLGRLPGLAMAVFAATVVSAWLSHAATAPLVAWLALMAAGLVSLTRAYAMTIAAPFERAPLRLFARDLQAIMLYVGFAWGAGSFLALPADATTLQAVAFGAGASIVVAAIARASDATACFAIPATVLSVAAALMRSGESGLFAGAAIAAAGFAVIAAAYVGERATAPASDAGLPDVGLPDVGLAEIRTRALPRAL